MERAGITASAIRPLNEREITIARGGGAHRFRLTSQDELILTKRRRQ
jgi:hypothetical protein